MRWLLPILVACGDAPPTPQAPADPVEVHAGVDRAVATTGDTITYTLRVVHDQGLEVDVPDPGAEIAGFRITDLQHDQRTAADGRPEARWTYALRADLVGSYVLPSVDVRWRSEGQQDWNTVQTSQLFIEVASVLPEGDEMPDDIREIKPLRPAPSRVPWLWIAGSCAAASVVALGVTIWWWRRRRARNAPPPPPHELAYLALDALRDVDHTDLDTVRAWTFAISEVLRAYIEGRFGLNATDLTSEEILAGLEPLDLAPGPGALLCDFLRDTDAVKYAALPPDERAVHATYERALQFVEQTVPVPDDTTAQGDEEAADA